MSISPELWSKLRSTLTKNPEMNEANTKGKLIEPVLQALGWDMLSDDVHREHPIRIGSSTAHADYALSVEGRIAALLEAKPLGEELVEDYAQQILSYAAVQKIKWCILTNGRTYKVFRSEWGPKPDDALFSEFELDPGKPLPAGLTNISRDTIQSGAMDVQASESRLLRLLSRLLGESFEELQAEVYGAARRLVYQEVKQEIPGITRDQITQTLEQVLRLELLPANAGQSQEELSLSPGSYSPGFGAPRTLEPSTPSNPWTVDGKSWHLTREYAPTIKEKLIELDKILLKDLSISRTSWNQKIYISYYVNNRIWLYLEPKATSLILTFTVKSRSFDSGQLAKELGVADYATAVSLSEKLSLPSSVEVYEQDEGSQTVVVRIKKDYDVRSDVLLKFLRRAREVCWYES